MAPESSFMRGVEWGTSSSEGRCYQQWPEFIMVYHGKNSVELLGAFP